MSGLIQDIIIELIAQADDSFNEWCEEKTNAVEFGKLLGFSEALSIIKSEVVGIDELEKLLDFDIDKRYLCA